MTVEKHYYTYLPGSRDRVLAMAERAAELGHPTWIHYHPYGRPCVLGCRNIPHHSIDKRGYGVIQ